jgi:hypothetical protein
MTNKSSTLQLYLKNASQFVRADTLLAAAAKKTEGLKSSLQRQMARFGNGPYPYRDWLRELAAFLEPVALEPFWVLLILPGASTLEDVDFFPASAVRAYRAIRPNDAPSQLESRYSILEMVIIQDRP